MATENQDANAGTGAATGNTGAAQGAGASGTCTGNAATGGTAKTWEPDEHAKAYAQREADRRVNEAVQAHKAETAKILANKETDAAKKLADIQAAQEASEQRAAENQRRADFMADAVNAGVSDLKAAWACAKAEDCFDKKGNPDFKTLKENHPALFIRPASANAGNGAGQAPSGTDMNQRIRQAAGVA